MRRSQIEWKWKLKRKWLCLPTFDSKNTAFSSFANIVACCCCWFLGFTTSTARCVLCILFCCRFLFYFYIFFMPRSMYLCIDIEFSLCNLANGVSVAQPGNLNNFTSPIPLGFVIISLYLSISVCIHLSYYFLVVFYPFLICISIFFSFSIITGNGIHSVR